MTKARVVQVLTRKRSGTQNYRIIVILAGNWWMHVEGGQTWDHAIKLAGRQIVKLPLT